MNGNKVFAVMKRLLKALVTVMIMLVIIVFASAIATMIYKLFPSASLGIGIVMLLLYAYYVVDSR